MLTAYHTNDLRQFLAGARRAGDRIALVPTMGNLHAGHMALVEHARAIADRVVVSVYVNPTQFAPGEDFAEYPRSFARDQERLLAAGVDCLFAPDEAIMYPDGQEAVAVQVGGVTEDLEGASRPHFFTGVATVVTKLLASVRPDVAVFGKKDYQQWVVIRRLVRNLLMDVAVEAVPIVREADGLALSSRNAYLSEAGRRRATGLYRALCAACETASDPGQVEASAREGIAAAGLEPEYVAVRQQGDLASVSDMAGPRVLLAAAYVEGTRLIDNVELDSCT